MPIQKSVNSRRARSMQAMASWQSFVIDTRLGHPRCGILGRVLSRCPLVGR